MGKPFEKELEKISTTFKWALTQDTKRFEDKISSTLNKPLISIGSGGSLSACSYASLLHQMHGSISKSMTPLELNYAKSIIKDINLLFVSASGKNTDILFGFKKAIQQEPSNIINLCMKEGTALEKLSEQYSISRTFGYNIPSGKDGFLATNSLVAFFIILYKAYGNQVIDKDFKLAPNKTFVASLEEFIHKIDSSYTFITLFGGWGQPVAVDLESKFAEAALANIFISDYRNFGHGRHHWFAKRGKQSAIIAIVTPDEEEIAHKTLNILPSYIPKLVLKSLKIGALSSIDLLVKSFYVSNRLGQIQQIDPGRPGVPSFGSKLYHLQYASVFRERKESLKTNERLAILRKTGKHSLSELKEYETKEWIKSFRKFIKNLNSTKFGAIVFDYDGTLCSHDDRFKNELTGEVINSLVSILKKGFVVGIVTGRGQSVRKVFQNSIESIYWKNIIMGYYNGSDNGLLSDNQLPNTINEHSKSLELIARHLKENFFIRENTTIEARPAQTTIGVNNHRDWVFIRKLILQIVHSIPAENIIILESSHSIDIIDKTKASKLNILSHCKERAKQLGIAEHCLCIGDKGQWPGNDYLLLSTPYSLSVDEVSAVPDNCWNIASAGIKNIHATLEYLSHINTHKGYMTFKYI